VIDLEYTLRPIGHVEKDDTGIYLVINSKIWDATTHIDFFSHLIVLWWIHERDTEEDRRKLIMFPPKNKGDEASGAFSCRSPARPNPIGHTIVKLLSVDAKNKRLEIDHMDANDSSPIISSQGIP